MEDRSSADVHYLKQIMKSQASLISMLQANQTWFFFNKRKMNNTNKGKSSHLYPFILVVSNHGFYLLNSWREHYSRFILRERLVSSQWHWIFRPRNDSEEWLVIIKHPEEPVILKAQGIQSPYSTFQQRSCSVACEVERVCIHLSLWREFSY